MKNVLQKDEKIGGRYSYFVIGIMLFVALSISFASFGKIRYNDATNIFVDNSLLLFPKVKETQGVYQLFSHGRPGELLINGEWKNAKKIADFLISNYELGIMNDELGMRTGLASQLRFTNDDLRMTNYEWTLISHHSPFTAAAAAIHHSPTTHHSSLITHLNIYGCNFAKGEKGRAAVAYLEKALGISVAASDDITGHDGDWSLEVGQPVAAINLPNYSENLQLDPTNLFSSTTTWVRTTVMCEGELLHTVQNGTDYIIRSGALGIDIYTMDPATGNLTLSQNFLNHAGFVQGALNTLVLNGVTYLYEENGNIANVYKFSSGTWSLVKEYQYTDVNPAPGTDAGYVGGAQTYVVNGIPYIYALAQYTGSGGNQFNRWQIDPATGLIIPSTQQTFSVGGTYIGTEFQIVNTAGGWKLIAATGSNYDNLRVYDMDATGLLTGTYTNIPVTAGTPPIVATTNMLKQAPYVNSDGNIVIAGGDQTGGQIIVYNPTTKTVVANVTSAAVVESVTFGKDGTNPNYLYITSTNSQGASVIWPQTVIFDLSTNTIVNSGTDLQGGYNGNPGFSSNNPPQYGSKTEMLVTSTTGNKFYIQQAASCSNNTDGWLAGVPTVLQSANGCNAGTTAMTLSATTASNTCPATTANISGLVSSTCPAGSSIRWYSSSTSFTTATHLADSTKAGAGTYYPVCYDAFNNCYSPAPATGVTVTINTCPALPINLTNTCPTATVNLTTAISLVSSLPAGTTLTWHNATPATDANKIDATKAGAGTYYAAFYDGSGATGCYSPTTQSVIITIVDCCAAGTVAPTLIKN